MGGEPKRPVAVPRAVLDGILAVRDSGRTNMLDVNAVARVALELGHDEAAAWVADPANRSRYAEGVFRGFGASGEELGVRPGAIMRYVGKRHPYLYGRRVKIVGAIDQDVWDVAPWIPDENRFSWVTSDALESELAPLEDEK